MSYGYDDLGREIAYTDADEQTTVTTFDSLDRPVTTEDGKGVSTNVYDPVTDRLVGINDSGVGDVVANYDQDGNLLTETLPNGVRMEAAYDSGGSPTQRSYRHEDCLTDCTLLSFAASYSVHGQVRAEQSTLSSRTYQYDAAGRLTASSDTPSGGPCVMRRYDYDSNGNRTGYGVVPALPDGSCDTAGQGQGVTHSYDTADRLVDEGYEYDPFGRTLAVPSSDAGGSQLEASYFVNDQVHTLTQGSVERSFELDPEDRLRARSTNGQTAEVYHYAGDYDAPSWTARPNSEWTRYIGDVTGSVSAVEQGVGEVSGNVAYQLTNLHGDIVGETDENGDLVAAYAFDEFGVPSGSPPLHEYGWLGAHERRSQLQSGIITMGARIYVPGLGRFLQVDPVPGGSANPYDYVGGDPLTQFDPSGEQPVRPSGVCSVSAPSLERIGKRGLVFAQGTISCVGNIHWKALRVCIQRYAGSGNQWITRGPCTHKKSAGNGRLSVGNTTKCGKSKLWRTWRVQVLGTATGGKPARMQSGYAYKHRLLRCK